MFEAWTNVIGGILEVAGIPGFLANISAFYEESDREGEELREFVQAWSSRYGTREVTSTELFNLNGNLPLGDGNDRSQKTKLGKLLSSKRDHQIGIHRISRGRIAGGHQHWRLDVVG